MAIKKAIKNGDKKWQQNGEKRRKNGNKNGEKRRKNGDKMVTKLR